MNRSIAVIPCLLLVHLLTGCKTYSYFNSPNDLLNKNVEIAMVDGRILTGALSVQFETGQSHSEFLKLVTANKEDLKIPARDILYYKLDNAFYYPKALDLSAFEIPYRDPLYTPNVSNLLFVKRVTDSTDRLQLFQLFKSRTSTSDGNDQYDYFLSFPGENRFTAWSIRGNKVFPDFEYKMSELLQDCPALAMKIRQKQDGYFVKQLSLDGKKLQVIKRIVAEYNACTAKP